MSAKRDEGMLPLMELSRKLMLTRLCSPSKWEDDGMAPLKRLWERSKCARFFAMPNDGIGPVKLLNDKSMYLSSIRFDNELGSIPLKLLLERSNSDKCLMLPMVYGNAPEKLVILTLKVWRSPLDGNSGNEPWRLVLNVKSINDNVPRWKIFCGNLPVNPHDSRLRVVKFLKLENVSGTGEEKLFPSRIMIDRFSSLDRDDSRGPVKLQLDMVSSSRPCNGNKALLHSCPFADIITPSRYNCLILVRFWTRL